jgi:hypothetical protein
VPSAGGLPRQARPHRLQHRLLQARWGHAIVMTGCCAFEAIFEAQDTPPHLFPQLDICVRVVGVLAQFFSLSLAPPCLPVVTCSPSVTALLKVFQQPLAAAPVIAGRTAAQISGGH